MDIQIFKCWCCEPNYIASDIPTKSVNNQTISRHEIFVLTNEPILMHTNTMSADKYLVPLHKVRKNSTDTAETESPTCIQLLTLLGAT